MKNLTKRAIKESFIKLINKKPLSAVTVQEIADDCEINRNTFYYHFDDIPSLIEEIVLDEFNEIVEKYPSIDTIENAFLAVLKFAEENKRALEHIYNSVNRNIFENYLWRFSSEIVENFVVGVTEGKNVSDDDKALLNKFLGALAVGLVLDYMNSGFKKEAQNDLHRICELANGMLEEIISRCENY